MPRAGIALGSNLGDRLGHLQQAVLHLRELASPDEPFLCALIYQSEPCQCPDGSPDFFNSVVEFDYLGSPLDLLSAIRVIENDLGRERGGVANAPRVIDLDLLYLGDHQCATEVLELPHPRMIERRFVLQPLADISPDLVLPGQVLSVGELLAMLPLDEVPLVVLDEGLE